MWPCGTPLHPDGLQQGQVATQCSGGDNHPALKAHRHFCPCSQRGNPPADEASCVLSMELSLQGLYQGMVSSGEGCQELYPCFFVLLCVIFFINHLSPRKHYTNVTSPRYPTIKPLENLTQTFSSSIWAAESTARCNWWLACTYTGKYLGLNKSPKHWNPQSFRLQWFPTLGEVFLPGEMNDVSKQTLLCTPPVLCLPCVGFTSIPTEFQPCGELLCLERTMPRQCTASLHRLCAWMPPNHPQPPPNQHCHKYWNVPSKGRHNTQRPSTQSVNFSDKKENSSLTRVGDLKFSCYLLANGLFEESASPKGIPTTLSLTLKFLKLMPVCPGLFLGGSCFPEVTISCTVHFLSQWLDCRAEMNVRIVCWIQYQITLFLKPWKRN